MRLNKNQIVYGGVLLLVLLFLIGYSYLTFGEEGAENTLVSPTLPQWEETGKDFETKTEALDALKERGSTPQVPSPYPDHMVDEKGYFNPDYMELEKNRIIDSIYSQASFGASLDGGAIPPRASSGTNPQSAPAPKTIEKNSAAQEMGLEHQLFFASQQASKAMLRVSAEVSRDQVLRKDSRIQLQTTEAVALGAKIIPKNTTLWGRVSFGANRVFISVAELAGKPVQLEAYDLQDGLPGVYLENSFRAEASSQLLQDVSQDINLPGVPSLRSLKNVFRRHQRNLKVTVLDGHELLLTTKTQTP